MRTVNTAVCHKYTLETNIAYARDISWLEITCTPYWARGWWIMQALEICIAFIPGFTRPPV